MKNNNFFYEEEKKELISINITPLIDIVFLLLVFFMLATSFIQKSTIEVNLNSGKSQIAEKKNVVTIILKKNGDISLNSKLIELSSIKKEIKNKLDQVEKQNFKLMSELMKFRNITNSNSNLILISFEFEG